MSKSMLITGGHVIDPANGVDEPRDVLVGEDGRISAVERPGVINAERADKVVDASGLVVAPGFLDIHVHLREPGGEAQETIETGCRAAAKGGFTSVWCMPNTNPTNDSVWVTRYILDRARESGGGIHVHPVAAVTKGLAGRELNDFGALLGAGAAGFTDDGRPVESAAVMRTAMMHARDLGATIFDHCEELSITGAGAMHLGPTSLRQGIPGIPRSSEALIVMRDGMLALETGCRFHVQHVSNQESVEAIRWLKARGARITAEASPHHLLLTDERVGEGETNAKMKPPLCEEADRQAIVAALEDGTLDCIATDQAPHTASAKARGFAEAPFGIIGMETAFASLHTGFVVRGKWTLRFLIEQLTSAPAKVMAGAMGEGKGTLGSGAPADLVLIDPKATWRFEERHVGSRSRNCPWIGETFRGRVEATFAGGRCVYRVVDAGASLARAASAGT